MGAGRHRYRDGRFDEAIQYFERATDLADDDFDALGMLTSSYAALGDADGLQRAARRMLERAERTLTHDNGDVVATSYGAYALAALGEGVRAKEWIDQALLIDPANQNMRYNLACAVCVYLKDADLALAVLEPALEMATAAVLAYVETDPDLAAVRDDPRFAAMLGAARTRTAAAGE